MSQLHFCPRANKSKSTTEEDTIIQQRTVQKWVSHMPFYGHCMMIDIWGCHHSNKIRTWKTKKNAHCTVRFSALFLCCWLDRHFCRVFVRHGNTQPLQLKSGFLNTCSPPTHTHTRAGSAASWHPLMSLKRIFVCQGKALCLNLCVCLNCDNRGPLKNRQGGGPLRKACLH